MNIKLKKFLIFAFFGVASIITPQSTQARTKAVIFVFADLLASARISMVKHLGWCNSVLNMGAALKSQKVIFEALHNRYGHQQGSVKAYDPQDPHDELPVVFVEWLLGKTPSDVCREAKDALKHVDNRQFIYGVLDIIFNPHKMADTFGVQSDILKLVKKINDGPAHPHMILVANCNDLMYDQLQTMAPGKEVLSNFKNTYISGKTKLLVEDPGLYRRIIAEHGYQPSEYLIITSNKYAAHAAKTAGMQVVVSQNNLYSDGKDHCKKHTLIKR